MHPCRCGRPLAGPKKLSWESNNRKLCARFVNLNFACWSRYSLEMFLIMSNLCMSAITLICLSAEPGVDKQLCFGIEVYVYHTSAWFEVIIGWYVYVYILCIYIYMCVWFWKEQLSSSTKNMTAVLQLGAMISSPFITNKPPRSSKTTDLLGLDQSLFLKQPIWLKSRKHIKPWENMMTKIHKSDSNLAQFWSKVAQKCSSVQKSEEKWYQEKGVWHQTWNGVWTAITMTCAHMGSLTVTVDVYVFN